MRQLQSYTEWLANAGKEEAQLGLQILLTHSILKDRHKNVTKAVFNTVMDSFERALFDNGSKPLSISFQTDYMADLKAKELSSFLETYQGASLENYAGKVFRDAEEFYNQVKVWENKSLWQYIKWWFRRLICLH